MYPVYMRKIQERKGFRVRMDKKFVVSITRQFGSLGRPIAKRLSELLDVEYYDRDIVEMAAKEMGEPVSVVSEIEETSKSFFSKMKFPLGTGEKAMKDRLFEIQKNIIAGIADRESCIIVGRCSDYILKDYKNCIKIYIYAPYEKRYDNCIHALNMQPKEAKKMIADVDRVRDEYHRTYANFLPADPRYKDIMIDSSLLGVEGTAQVLADIVKKKFLSRDEGGQGENES